MVDFWTERGRIEFCLGCSLRRDSKLHSRMITVGAQEGLTSAERLAIVDALFAEIDGHIDETISATLPELN